MTDRIITKLYSLGKSIFEVSVLQSWCNAESYSALTELVAELESREIISPVKSSKTNGCNPPLYIKYRISYRGRSGGADSARTGIGKLR